MKNNIKKISKAYKAKSPPIAIRLLAVFLLFVSGFMGLFKRWDGFGLSLGALLILVILVCYELLSQTINERFEQLRKLIDERNNQQPKDEQEQ